MNNRNENYSNSEQQQQAGVDSTRLSSRLSSSFWSAEAEWFAEAETFLEFASADHGDLELVHDVEEDHDDHVGQRHDQHSDRSNLQTSAISVTRELEHVGDSLHLSTSSTFLLLAGAAVGGTETIVHGSSVGHLCGFLLDTM